MSTFRTALAAVLLSALAVVFLSLPADRALAGTVTIDPAGYTSRAYIQDSGYNIIRTINGSPDTAGRPVRITLPDGTYYVKIAHGVAFSFVLHEGARRIVCKPDQGLACAPSKITFRTTSICITPWRYRGSYEIHKVDPGKRPRRVHLLKGVTATGHRDAGYTFKLGHGLAFRFNVDTHGNVYLNRFYRQSAWGLAGWLNVRTVGIRITPVDYGKGWQVQFAEPDREFRSGARIVRLIPGVSGTYNLLPETGVNCGSRCKFRLGPDGVPVPSVLRFHIGRKPVTFRLERR